MTRPTGSLVPKPDPDARERRIAGGLFFATCCSVFVVNLLRWREGSLLDDPDAVGRALLFTVLLMGILLAHEMGHYAVARLHGFRLTMPWFLPAPFLVGTFGAVIRLEESPRTRTGLLEMGAAGPLAGLVAVALALALGALFGGEVEARPAEVVLARPLLLYLFGTGPVSPVDPVAFAAWIGCLLTAMNLLPFGQLDGGHIASALAPEHAEKLSWGVTALLLAGGLLWPGWPVWAVVLHLLGTRHAVAPRRAEARLSPRARWAAGAAVLAFLLTFTPAPITWPS